MTHRSIGDENSDVGTVGAAACQEFGAVLSECRAVAAVRRRTVKARGDFTDPARRSAAPQLRERKPGIAVLGGGVGAVDGEMGDPQIVVDAAFPGIDIVEFGGGVVGRSGALIAFAGLVAGRGGDRCGTALCERLFERLERRKQNSLVQAL